MTAKRQVRCLYPPEAIPYLSYKKVKAHVDNKNWSQEVMIDQ